MVRFVLIYELLIKSVPLFRRKVRILQYALQGVDPLDAVLFVGGAKFQLLIQLIKQTIQLLHITPEQMQPGEHHNDDSKTGSFHDRFILEHISQHNIQAGIPVLFIKCFGEIHGKNKILVHGYLQPGAGAHVKPVF